MTMTVVVWRVVRALPEGAMETKGGDQVALPSYRERTAAAGGPRQGVPLLEGRERIGGERGSGRGLTSYLSFRAAAALPAGWDTEWGGQGALSGSRAAAEKGTREFSPSARNWPRLLSPHFIAEAFGLRRQVPSLV